jgi:hypothetical protein
VDHVGDALEPLAVPKAGTATLLDFQRVKELEPSHEA